MHGEAPCCVLPRPYLRGMKAKLAVAGALLCAAGACVRNPATGERQLSLISKEQEVALGEEGARVVIDTIGLVEQAALEQYVKQVGGRIAGSTEQPGLPWSFGVVDDPAVNAFALPGGKIFVTRGLMARLSNEAQLATVLGHEAGHVTARHSAERMSKAQLAQLGLGASAIFVEPARDLIPIASAGLGLLFLKFSRDDEYQADELGVRYGARAGYAVTEMPEVFRTLERASKRGNEGATLPEWLSTHPDPQHRIERVKESIAKAEAEDGDGNGTDQGKYLRYVDGLTYGDDPRAGYFRGDEFIHPVLRFTLRLPEGWERQNMRQAVVAASPEGDAAVQLALSGKDDPSAALAQFAQKEGVSIGAPADLVPELPSASARFQADAQEGRVAGIVTYVALDGRTYEILGFASEERFQAQADLLARVHGSFAEVTDERLTAVEPARIELYKVKSPMPLAELYRQRKAGVELAELAELNQLDENAPLTQGQLLKWVHPGKRPE